MNANEINEIYEQFKTDLNINIKMPELIAVPQSSSNSIAQNSKAQIGKVTQDIAELFLGKIFFDSKVNIKSLYPVLYHEFIHIVDRLTYFQDITDEREHRNKLFPYTEFNAAKNEMKKRLELSIIVQKELVVQPIFMTLFE